METDLPETDSEESNEGTLLHKHAANPQLDRKKLKRSHRDLLEINEKTVRTVFERISQQFGDEVAVESGADNLTWWLHRGIKALFPGHPDLWEYRPSKLLVILDYKFGFKTVTPASANLQLRSYGVMGAELRDAENVVVAITQPRLSFDDRYTMAVYSRADIEASREQLYEVWDNAKKPDAPLVAGEEQCRYCKARTICPALAEKINSGLSVVSDARGLTKAAVENRIAQCSDEQVGLMIEAIRFANFITDPLMDVARERIAAGGMSGWKLGKETEVREVSDVLAAMDALAERAGVPKDKLRAALKMKISEVESAVRDVNGGTWKDARDKTNDVLGDLIVRHSKKPSVEKVK